MPTYNVSRVQNRISGYEEHIGQIEADTAEQAEQWAESEFGRADCHMVAIDAPACGNEYHVAFMEDDGSWHIAEAFEATDDAAANAYADRYYADYDWYVLNGAGQNINAR